MSENERCEKDSLGEIQVPESAYYGIHTVRAMGNFPISGLTAAASLIEAVMQIKKAAAKANLELSGLEEVKANAIIEACDEVLEGGFRDQFVVDVFQMGAGTSFHMNCNEVIANRAAEILGGTKGIYDLIHPNDHVNMGQSTNDVFPTAMRLSVLFDLRDHFHVQIGALRRSLERKSEEFDPVIKSGRTHLRDAAPIRMGQEFRGYAVTILRANSFLDRAAASLLELGIGGTAVGTGLNSPPGFARAVVDELSKNTGLPLAQAEDMREAMQSQRPMAEVSSALRSIAMELGRIANDLRLLSSGPRTGLSEIVIPPVAPGSSMMPGKYNPSMLEMLNMVCFQVIGCDTAVCQAVQAGQLELNVMMPVIAFNLHFMIRILGNAIKAFREKCLDGIIADRDQCRNYALNTLGMATVLSPLLGYAVAAEVAEQAVREGKSLSEVVRERDLLSEDDLSGLLDPIKLTEPGIPGKSDSRD